MEDMDETRQDTLQHGALAGYDANGIPRAALVCGELDAPCINLGLALVLEAVRLAGDEMVMGHLESFEMRWRVMRERRYGVRYSVPAVTATTAHDTARRIVLMVY